MKNTKLIHKIKILSKYRVIEIISRSCYLRFLCMIFMISCFLKFWFSVWFVLSCPLDCIIAESSVLRKSFVYTFFPKSVLHSLIFVIQKCPLFNGSMSDLSGRSGNICVLQDSPGNIKWVGIYELFTRKRSWIKK